MRAEASIAHVDMDCFFAAVEQHDRPSLAGRPVIVGGLGPRGVVSTASYPARATGVHSATPMAQARKLCPDGVFLPVRFARYREVSATVMEVLARFSPLLEAVSVDEAFLDLAAGGHAGTDPGRVLAEIRTQVRAATGLACSAGAGTSKLVAKLASDAAKPDGALVVAAGRELEFLHPLPVRRLWGVGPATADRLLRVGVRTVADLHRLPAAELVAMFGDAHGTALFRMARADDDRPVTPERERRSVGAEETFPRDLHRLADLDRQLEKIARDVADRLAARGWAGRTVTLKVRHGDFSTLTRSTTATAATADRYTIAGAAQRLLRGVDLTAGVRLLGISVSGLADFVQEELPLFPPAGGEQAGPGGPGLPAGQPAARTPYVGCDVEHPVFGRGWVEQLSGHWVSVRFENAGTGPVPPRTFDLDLAPLRVVD